MAPFRERPARDQLVRPDPDFYTDLWGSKRRTAPGRAANTAGDRRLTVLGVPIALCRLRVLAGVLALLAGALMLVQLALGLIADAPDTVGIGTTGTGLQLDAVDPAREGAGRWGQATSLSRGTSFQSRSSS